jgi:hypothetical protein
LEFIGGYMANNAKWKIRRTIIMKKTRSVKILITFTFVFCAALSCATNERAGHLPSLEGTIWQLTDRYGSRYQKFFPGGSLLSLDQAIDNSTWYRADSKVYFSINNGFANYGGAFTDRKTIKGKAVAVTGETWNFEMTLVTEPFLLKQYTCRDTWDPSSIFPPFTTPLYGHNEVRIKNPNPFSITMAIRGINGSGMDLNVPAQRHNSVFIPDGDYTIYFSFSDGSQALYRGDNFSLSDEGFEINIGQAVDSNYTIRRVEGQQKQDGAD